MLIHKNFLDFQGIKYMNHFTVRSEPAKSFYFIPQIEVKPLEMPIVE